MQLIPSLVHNDQLGFSPNREAMDDICRALNLIHLDSSKDIPTLLISAILVFLEMYNPAFRYRG